MVISPDYYLMTTDPNTGREEYVWTLDRVKEAWRKTNQAYEAALKYGMFKKVVLLVGVPASGKSTWLRSHEERDVLYVDATFTTRSSRYPFIGLAGEKGIPVEAIVMDTPIAVCMDRNSCRPKDRRVPEENVINMATKLQGDLPTTAEGFSRVTHVRDSSGRTSALMDDYKYRKPWSYMAPHANAAWIDRLQQLSESENEATNPVDGLEAIAEEAGVSTDGVESYIYGLASAHLNEKKADEWKDKVPGGRADKKKPEDFDQKELAKGIEVEKEHTTNPELAREIAMDHLTEFPDYYKALAKMEKSLAEAKSATFGGAQMKLESRIASKWMRKKAHSKIEVMRNLLGMLHAVYWTHWTSHWRSNGGTSYGDHLLFERLYDGVKEDIDGLAEKLVAAFGNSSVDPLVIQGISYKCIENWNDPDPVKASLRIEQGLMDGIEKIYAFLDESDGLSLGLDDFLQGLSSKHETHIYLLQQRSSVG